MVCMSVNVHKKENNSEIGYFIFKPDILLKE